MKIQHDGVGESRRDRPDHVPARIRAVGDDQDFHGTYVSQVKDCLGQVHFLPRGDENGCVEDLPAALRNGLVPIADSCDFAAGAGKAVFHLIPTFRANQQGLIKPTRQCNDQNKG